MRKICSENADIAEHVLPILIVSTHGQKSPIRLISIVRFVESGANVQVEQQAVVVVQEH